MRAETIAESSKNTKRLKNEALSSLDFWIGGGRRGGAEGDGNAVGEILKKDGEAGPFEVPAVFEGEKSVAAGKDRRHGEGAVGIGLIAMEKGHVLGRVFRNEKNHGASKRLAVFESGACDGALGFREVDDELDRG